jgi:fructose transport system ATP-binding protein
VFEVADRIHIQRLGRRVGVVTPAATTMEDAVAVMTGAIDPGKLQTADTGAGNGAAATKGSSQ